MNNLTKAQKPLSESHAPSSSAAREPVVEISRLTKSFGNFDAVKEVSLKLEAGKTLVLLGESGSGKTTVLRCVAGLERATSGTIRLGGTVVDDGKQQVPPELRRVGMVFQSYALWPQMTALENVVFAGTRDRKGAAVKREVKAQAEALLETVGLASMKGRLPGQLSGGQQQRVALARALAGDVRLLLMDEPLSALDQALREELRLGLRAQIQRSGLACLYVTHDQEEALAMADELIVMRHGVIEEHGHPREIFERPATAFGAGFLGAKNSVLAKVTQLAQPYATARVGGDTITFSPVDALAVGEIVEIRWRREHTRLTPAAAPGAPNQWTAQVTSAVYLGHRWEVGLNSLGVPIRAWSESEASDTRVAHVSPQRLLGYKPNTEFARPSDTS